MPRFDNGLVREYRGPIMGLAIAIIVIFHFHPESSFLHLLNKYGWAGVDMFIFVSAIGLCYSLNTKPQVWNFYKRRILRIIPTWWLFLTTIIVVSIIAHKPHPSTFVQYLCYYTGVGWWLNGLFERPLFIYYYEWYVPTQLALYLAFPLLFYIPRKIFPMVYVLGLIGVELMLKNDVLSSVSTSYPRLLSFLVGIIYYRFFFDDTKNNENEYIRGRGHIVALSMLIIGISLRLCGAIGLMVFFSMMMPFVFYLLAVLLKGLRLSKYPVLDFFGSISLELYLVHIYWHVPVVKLGGVTINGDILLIPKFILSLFLALCLKWGVELFRYFLNKIHF